MGSLIILLAIWIIMGLGLGYYAGTLFKGDRPYGTSGDLIAAVLTAIAVGLADWFLVPRLFPTMSQLMVFLIAILEPLAGVLIVLWIMRRVKR